MNKTSIRRSYPARPTKQQPVKCTGVMNSENALTILKDFYLVAKQSLKAKNSEVTFVKENEAAHLLFVADGFTLSLNFTEGGQS